MHGEADGHVSTSKGGLQPDALRRCMYWVGAPIALVAVVTRQLRSGVSRFARNGSKIT